MYRNIDLNIQANIPEQDPNPIIGLSPTGQIIYSNPKGEEILAYWEAIKVFIPEEIMRAAHLAILRNEVVREELIINEQIFLFSLVWIKEFNQVNIYGMDITQLKSAQKDMATLAHYDGLTRIANRQYFEKKFIEMLQDTDPSANLCILLIDLDDFKAVNDSYGHPIGDRLLQAATRRMLRCLRKDDFIARIGGDEFVVLINDTTPQNACQIADSIILKLAKPFQFGGYRMEIGASIGVASAPEAGTTPYELLKNVDIAMYEAKKSGKNKAFFFSDTLHKERYQRYLAIRKDLKFATSKSQFYLEYQPQFDLKTNSIFGFEALLRWIHPEIGLISPNEFIPFAEQSGIIHVLGQWIIEQAISDYTNEIFPLNNSQLSINISLPQLTDARFIDTLSDTLAEHDLKTDNLILDLSEHILTAHLTELPKSLKTLSNNHIKLSLDNYGSPSIPLTTLLDFPLNYLKFDHILLKNLANNPKRIILVRGLINLASQLGMQVIQKGVETQEQDRLLKELGCPYAQGLYYCKPMRLPELIKFLGK